MQLALRSRRWTTPGPSWACPSRRARGRPPWPEPGSRSTWCRSWRRQLARVGGVAAHVPRGREHDGGAVDRLGAVVVGGRDGRPRRRQRHRRAGAVRRGVERGLRAAPLRAVGAPAEADVAVVPAGVADVAPRGLGPGVPTASDPATSAPAANPTVTRRFTRRPEPACPRHLSRPLFDPPGVVAARMRATDSACSRRSRRRSTGRGPARGRRRGGTAPYWDSWPLAAPWGYVALCTLT